MKQVVLLLILFLGLDTTGLAQGSTTSKPSSDSLIIVEEDALVRSLVALVQARDSVAEVELREVIELLRLQLLFDLFAPQDQPLPNATPVATAGDQTLLRERIALLERMLGTQPSSPQISLRPTTTKAVVEPHQAQRIETRMVEREVQTPQRSRDTTTTATTPRRELSPRRTSTVVVNTTRENKQQVAELERQLAELEARLADTTSVAEVSALSASAVADTIRLVSREVMLQPRGFQRSVFFTLGSHAVGAQAEVVLSEVVAFLREFGSTRICLRGFASPDGSTKANELLARRRLAAVEAYLRSQGIASDRIVVEQASIDRQAIGHQIARRVDVVQL